MRVNEIRVAGCTPRRERVRRQKHREQQDLPGATAQISNDPVPIREPEVAEGRRRDDLDVDARRPESEHRVADESTGDVVRPTRVRRRENGDLHSRRAPTATAGRATASVANT